MIYASTEIGIRHGRRLQAPWAAGTEASSPVEGAPIDCAGQIGSLDGLNLDGLNAAAHLLVEDRVTDGP